MPIYLGAPDMAFEDVLIYIDYSVNFVYKTPEVLLFIPKSKGWCELLVISLRLGMKLNRLYICY